MRADITIRQMRGFLQVVLSGGISHAAERMGLSQSGLTLLIQSLEKALERSLFDRSTRTLRLTEAGRTFLPLAQRIVGDVDLALTEDRSGENRRRLVVSALPTLAVALMPRAIDLFKTAMPNVRVLLRDALTEDLVEQVRSGRSQIGLGAFLGRDAELTIAPLFRDRLVAVSPARQTIGRGRPMTWEALAKRPLILMNHDSNIRGLADEAFAKVGQTILPAYEVAFIATAIAMVRAGHGVTIVPRLEAEAFRSDDVVISPLKNPVVYREIGLLSRRGAVVTPEFSGFVDALLKAFPK
jgi:LysR family carnitine catabolism transcriptional activator